jgi:hypothetical protein
MRCINPYSLATYCTQSFATSRVSFVGIFVGMEINEDITYWYLYLIDNKMVEHRGKTSNQRLYEVDQELQRIGKMFLSLNKDNTKTNGSWKKR